MPIEVSERIRTLPSHQEFRAEPTPTSSQEMREIRSMLRERARAIEPMRAPRLPRSELAIGVRSFAVGFAKGFVHAAAHRLIERVVPGPAGVFMSRLSESSALKKIPPEKIGRLLSPLMDRAVDLMLREPAVQKTTR